MTAQEILINKGYKNFKITGILKKSSESSNLGDVMGDVHNNVNRVYTGCLNGDGYEKQLTQDSRNKKPFNKMWNSIFCKSTKFGGRLLSGFLGLLN